MEHAFLSSQVGEEAVVTTAKKTFSCMYFFGRYILTGAGDMPIQVVDLLKPLLALCMISHAEVVDEKSITNLYSSPADFSTLNFPLPGKFLLLKNKIKFTWDFVMHFCVQCLIIFWGNIYMQKMN